MKDLLRSSKFIIPVLLIASAYIILVIYLTNTQLVVDTVIGSFPFSYKVNLLVALLEGMWTAMTPIGLSVLVITALLTGANLTLITKRISALRSSSNLHFVVGGSSLLGVISSGCASCGLSIISLLGLTGSLVYLPLRGEELSYLSVVLLTVSLYFILRGYKTDQSCNIKLANT